MIRTLKVAASLAVLAFATVGHAQAVQPWMNTKLSPDERAALLEKELTLDERIGLVHGPMSMPIFGIKKPEGAIVVDRNKCRPQPLLASLHIDAVELDSAAATAPEA